MAQLKPTQWASQRDLQAVRGAVEAALRDVYEALEDLDILKKQIGVIAVGMVNLNTAVLEIQQALFEDDSEQAEEPEWNMDTLAEEPYEPDEVSQEVMDLVNDNQPEEERATDEGMPERQERIRQARQEARGVDPIAAFVAANSASTAEMAAADDDINAIGGLPEEGILISPGEVTPGLTDLGGGND